MSQLSSVVLGGGGGGGTVKTLQGNTGGTVSPNGAGNIFVVGDGTTVNVVGTPGSNTLTISAGSALAETYDGNSGTATPSGGILNIKVANKTLANFLNGTTNFYASGNTLTLTFSDQFDSTGVGYGALTNQVGDINTGSNTAFGFRSLGSLVTGANNTAVGTNSGASWNGAANLGDNVFIGNNSGFSATTATGNVFIGAPSGENLLTGNYNVIIGPSDSMAVPFPMSSGYNYTGAESNNICISNIGVTGDNNVLRLGSSGTGVGQVSTAYIGGIAGVNLGTAKVVTNTGLTDQLGTSAITAGTGISINTATPNEIIISATVSTPYISWFDVTGTTQAMAVNSGYIADNAALVTMTLPSVAPFGSVFAVGGGVNGTGGWKIAQNAGQTIHFGNQNTTTGVTGSLASTLQYDSVMLLAIKANTDFTVLPGTQGNITVT